MSGQVKYDQLRSRKKLARPWLEEKEVMERYTQELAGAAKSKYGDEVE